MKHVLMERNEKDMTRATSSGRPFAVVAIAIGLICALWLWGCSDQGDGQEEAAPSEPTVVVQDQDQEGTETMKIEVNGREFTAVLDDNVTAQALEEMLPLTVPMDNLYAREMCYHLPDALPTEDARTQGYEVGEIIYWPPMHSLVILYAQNGERFSHQKLGHIEGDIEGFFEGSSTLEVTFSR